MRPGVDVLIVDGAPAGSAQLNTGTAFMAGVTQRGPVGQALKVKSVADYGLKFGQRSGGSLMYDSVGAYFAEGGGDLYVSRVSGADALAATGDLGTSLTIDAESPGAWGNGIKVTAIAPPAIPTPPAGAVVLTVEYGGKVVERSSVLTAVEDGEAFGDRSAWVNVTAIGVDLPAVAATVTLAAGADDNVADSDALSAALSAFEAGFGPGQVLAPGLTDHDSHGALLAHVDAYTRCALLDAPDTGDVSELAAAAAELYEHDGCRFASLWAPYAVYPAEVSPATVQVPFSAVEAGLIARVDRAGNPNAPAAAADGIARLAVDLTQTYPDADRTALNAAGVDLAKLVYGDVRAYGYRTVAGPLDENWLWFGNSRTLMAIAWECRAVAETYVLKQIDGRRQIFARLNKDLRGVCARYYDLGALFGETPEEAYSIDTSEAVNTIDTIKAGEIHAVVRVKTSPSAEWVVIEIVKVPVDKPVAIAA